MKHTRKLSFERDRPELWRNFGQNCFTRHTVVSFSGSEDKILDCRHLSEGHGKFSPTYEDDLNVPYVRDLVARGSRPDAR